MSIDELQSCAILTSIQTPSSHTHTPRQGHASMISEVAASLGPSVKPGAVLVAVGGGGLLCGVIQGLKDIGWTDVPIIAMETVGADCFNAAVKAGRVVTLDDITRLEVKGVYKFSGVKFFS